MFSPDGVVPSTFWPDEEGENFTLKESLKPLEPLRTDADAAWRVRPVRGDGDTYMRGHRLPADRDRTLPGNVQGGSDTRRAGRAASLLTRRSRTSAERPATRTRFGSLSSASWFPIMRDWTRYVLCRAEQAARAHCRSLPDFLENCMAGERPGDAEERSGRISEDLKKVRPREARRKGSCWDEHASLVREMERICAPR